MRPTVGQRRRVRAAKAQDELPLPCSAPPCPTVIKIVCLINANDGSAVFSRRSQKQKLTSRSSTESELIALASETDDTVVFRQMLADLGLLCHVPVPVHFGDPGDTELEGGIVHEDNMSAVIIIRDRSLGKSLSSWGKPKHLSPIASSLTTPQAKGVITKQIKHVGATYLCSFP